MTTCEFGGRLQGCPDSSVNSVVTRIDLASSDREGEQNWQLLSVPPARTRPCPPHRGAKTLTSEGSLAGHSVGARLSKSRTTPIGTSSCRQGQRPSISSTSVQLRNVRTITKPARRPRLVKVSSIAMVFTISAATSTSRPSSSDLPMWILYWS